MSVYFHPIIYIAQLLFTHKPNPGMLDFPKLTNVSSLTSLSAHKCTLSGDISLFCSCIVFLAGSRSDHCLALHFVCVCLCICVFSFAFVIWHLCVSSQRRFASYSISPIVAQNQDGGFFYHPLTSQSAKSCESDELGGSQRSPLTSSLPSQFITNTTIILAITAAFTSMN